MRSEAYLVHLAYFAETNRFGTFLFDSERERLEQQAQLRSSCLWKHLRHLHGNSPRLYNVLYTPTAPERTSGRLRPYVEVSALRLWPYYTRNNHAEAIEQPHPGLHDAGSTTVWFEQALLQQLSLKGGDAVPAGDLGGNDDAPQPMWYVQWQSIVRGLRSDSPVGPDGARPPAEGHLGRLRLPVRQRSVHPFAEDVTHRVGGRQQLGAEHAFVPHRYIVARKVSSTLACQPRCGWCRRGLIRAFVRAAA